VTLARVELLIERIGITRVGRLTGLDVVGVPVSVAVRPSGKLLSSALGKGMTPELADVSAIMESIEIWHAENLAAPAAVGAAGEVGPTVELAPAAAGWMQVEAPRELAWVTVTELHRGERRLASAASFDLDTAAPGSDRLAARFVPTTTGLASGNTHHEALLHALCEVIERDAVARLGAMTAAALEARRIDLKSIVHGPARGVLERFARAGLGVEVIDATSDVGMAVVHATIVDGDELRGGHIDHGVGAHVVPEIALVRALVEAAQARVAYVSGSRDDFWPDDYTRGGAPRRPVREGRRAFSVVPRIEASGFASAVEAVLGRLRDDVWILDHTRPEIGIPVVHVKCPVRQDAARAGR
jgi:ribosomal protein S12 methylthiotransferase accessory factor